MAWPIICVNNSFWLWKVIVLTIKKCRYCGKPFDSNGSEICTVCAGVINDAYIKVRRYIYQNPDQADFAATVKNTQVPEKLLSYLIDSGRLGLNSDGNGNG